MHEQNPNTRLVLIGDGELKEKILKLIKDLQIEDFVILPGFRKDVFAIESKCNAYVMTSLFEGFPNALTEAMCLGLPVISTDCKSGPKEILAPEMDLDSEIKNDEEADYGILVPAFDTEEDWTYYSNDETYLSEAMNMIIDAKKARHYAKQSKNRAKDFSEEKFYEDLIGFIK